MTEPSTALVELGTLQASTPAALVSGATQISDQLAKIIRDKKLANKIQGKEYVRVEGWTTLAALLGVIAREDKVHAEADGSYIATVSLVRMTDGSVISTASAECGMDEPKWANGPRYARRSMAITRATGKAARLAFSWIMALAGFQPTPAEEMDGVIDDRRAAIDGGPPGDYPFQAGTPHPGASEIPLVVPFGKNKGRKWSELNDNQLQWYVECDNEGAREAASAELQLRRPNA